MRSHAIGCHCFSCDTASPLAPSPDLFLLILPNLVYPDFCESERTGNILMTVQKTLHQCDQGKIIFSH